MDIAIGMRIGNFMQGSAQLTRDGGYWFNTKEQCGEQRTSL